MPYKLSPSGFCVYYTESDHSRNNLLAGRACYHCKRVAGHSLTCPEYKFNENVGNSSRPNLFNACAVLWAHPGPTNFLTFTLPSRDENVFQRASDCPTTGDLIIAEKFSRVLEAYKVRLSRRGKKLSYVWVSEAQMKRQEKYGGIGDIHFHLVCNQLIKNDARQVVDFDTLEWLQDRWCDQVGVIAKNCLDVQPVPRGVNSIPAYLAKYMGKGSQRKILSRRFAATRDLTKFKPITLHSLPQEIKLIRENTMNVSPTFQVNTWYFHTQETLEQYGSLFLDESNYSAPRTTKGVKPVDIIRRAIARQKAQVYGRTVH